MTIQSRFVLLFVSLAILVATGACASVPTASPTPPSGPPESSAAAPCVHDRDEGNPLLAGWITGRLAAVFRHGPCVFDPVQGWKALGPREAGRFATDGSTLAGSLATGSLTVVAADGTFKAIALPDWGVDWAFWGSQLSSMAGGGYVLGLVPSLVRVSASGSLTEDPIPVGFLLVGPTSDPSTFILRADLRETAPEAMNGPYAGFLWRVGEATPLALRNDVVSINGSQPPDLVWLADRVGTWWRVDAAGALVAAIPPNPPWMREPDVTGRYLIEQLDRSRGCERQSPPTCRVRLFDRATGRVLAQVNAGSNSEFVWSGSTVWFIPTTADPVRQPAADQIVQLSPEGASLVPLPAAP